MRSTLQPTWTAILLSGALGLTACSTPTPRAQIGLTSYLTTPQPDPAKPALPPPGTVPLSPTAAEERKAMWDTYVKPLMGYSVRQAETTAAERRRAKGLVDLIGAANKAAKPPSLLDRLRGKL